MQTLLLPVAASTTPASAEAKSPGAPAAAQVRVENDGGYANAARPSHAALATDSFGIVLTPITTAFNGHAGIEHHQSANKLLVTANGPAGQPHNFELITADGAHAAFSNVAGWSGELRLAAARDDRQGISRGGFAPGEMFTGTGVPGVIARVSADGAAVQNPWATLTGETGLLNGGLYVDRTDVFGGDVIAVTTSGGVWRINAAGQPTLLTNLGTRLEGVTTVPSDPDRYGPWAGKILAGAPVQRSYTWGHTLISQSQLINGAWTQSFYGTDGHGSVRLLTDSAGNVTDTYDYDAFGNLIARTGTTPNNYLYAGEQFDADLGVYFQRARYYDQRRGRFLSLDPFAGFLDEPESLHKYLYVGADPVNLVDPSGMAELGEYVQRAKERVQRSIVYLRQHGRDILCKTINTSSKILSIPGVVSGLADLLQKAIGFGLRFCPRKPGGDTGLTTVYRVEGIPNQRIAIGTDVNVNIIGDGIHWLNFGRRARAEEFLAERIGQGLEGATLEQFLASKFFCGQTTQDGSA